MPRQAFLQSDVERAIRAVVKRGLEVASVEIAPGGAIRVLTRSPVGGVPINDHGAVDWVSLAGEAQDHERA